MPVTLHDYNSADFETLYEIDRACYPRGIAYSRRDLREFLEHAESQTLVARAGDGSVAGFLIAEARGAEAHIITIDVMEEHRRSGIGSALLRGIEQRLAARGVRVVHLETATTNEAGVAFWQRHGYRSCGVLRGYYLGRLDAYRMRKSLDSAPHPAPVSDYLLSVILGVVEGLTEFLPVSSTAHLRIAEALLHISLTSSYWKMYTVVIQLGPILCLPIYFRERIIKFLTTFPRGERGDRTILTHPIGLVAVAFVVTAVPSLLLTKVIGKNLESLYVIASAFIIGGIVMWVIDARNAKWEKAGAGAAGSAIRTWHVEEMNLGQAIWIGACQILSPVFPGTSRSMSTITGGQVAGMSRAAALEFSFLLSMPIMAAATGLDLAKAVLGKGDDAIGVSGIGAHGWALLGIGFIVSFVVAYGTVVWFMNWVRTRGFAPFAVYRLIAGILLFLWVSGRLG